MRMRGNECSDLKLDTGCEGCLAASVAVTRGYRCNGYFWGRRWVLAVQ